MKIDKNYDINLIKRHDNGINITINDLEFISMEYNKEEDFFKCYVYKNANQDIEPEILKIYPNKY